ncbi:type 4a pilus biogenesis protein PilO [Candidatus Dojkabacteria bacterium]|uniref:Type 4a pilus biogenesis protein PilO n=1 Tax=Candidatus Dojkabacteria bacterium TaxID=2099670 RepID=A0A847VDE3_9BACT|nr:type 4a pilus biogenesis protein PilO [Candidatus Dojkabacteria bacterium]
MGIAEPSQKTEYAQIIKKGASKKVDMVFTGLTFIAATLLIVFAIVPTVQTVKDIDREIKKKEQMSAALGKKLEALTSLDTQYNQNKEIFDSLELIFPTTKEFTLLLANIDAVTQRNNFILQSISFAEYRNRDYQTEATVLNPFSVRLSVAGSKADLTNLLKDLEQMPMFPAIESMAYSSKVDKDGNINYSISLRVYHLLEHKFYE